MLQTTRDPMLKLTVLCSPSFPSCPFTLSPDLVPRRVTQREKVVTINEPDLLSRFEVRPKVAFVASEYS